MITQPSFEELIIGVLELRDRGLSASDIVGRYPGRAAEVSEVLGIISTLERERDRVVPLPEALSRVLSNIPEEPVAGFARSSGPFSRRGVLATFAFSAGALAVALFALSGQFSGTRTAAPGAVPEAAPVSLLSGASESMMLQKAGDTAGVAALTVTGTPEDIMSGAIMDAASDAATFQAEQTSHVTLVSSDMSAAQDVGQFFNENSF